MWHTLIGCNAFVKHAVKKLFATSPPVILSPSPSVIGIKVEYPHIEVALRARELCSTIIDIHHLEIKTQCLKLMA